MLTYYSAESASFSSRLLSSTCTSLSFHSASMSSLQSKINSVASSVSDPLASGWFPKFRSNKCFQLLTTRSVFLLGVGLVAREEASKGVAYIGALGISASSAAAPTCFLRFVSTWRRGVRRSISSACSSVNLIGGPLPATSVASEDRSSISSPSSSVWCGLRLVLADEPLLSTSRASRMTLIDRIRLSWMTARQDERSDFQASNAKRNRKSKGN